VEEVDGVMIANWSFKFADTPDEESPLRRGFFTVFPSLEAYTAGSEKFSKVLLPPSLPPFHQVLKTALAGQEAYSQPTNVFHVAVAQLPESQQPEVGEGGREGGREGKEAKGCLEDESKESWSI